MDRIDKTDEWEIYENGKTITCDCGQGIGVKLKQTTVKCATCSSVLVDEKASVREPPETEKGQTTLGQW